MKRIILLFGLCCTQLVLSQDGTPDTSFGVDGFVEIDIDDRMDFSTNIMEQGQNGYLVAINSTGPTTTDTFITRVDLNGNLDTSFGVSGFTSRPMENGQLSGVFSNEEFLVSYRGSSLNGIEKFTAQGILDPNFAGSGSLEFSNSFVTLLNLDQSILVAERVDNQNITIFKYLLDGQADTSFGTNGAVSIQLPDPFDSLRTFKQGPDSKWYLSLLYSDSNLATYQVCRFLENGELDLSFGIQGVAKREFEIENFELISGGGYDFLSDGSLYCALSVGGCETEIELFHLKLRSSGEWDSSFGDDGLLSMGANSMFSFEILVQDNDRVLTAQNWTECFEWDYLNLQRHYPNGSIDQGFSYAETSGYEPLGTDITLDTGGKIIAVSTTPWFNGDENVVIARFNNNPLAVTEENLPSPKVFPNPSFGNFNIDISGFYEGPTAYTIYDVTGRTIDAGMLNSPVSEISINHASSGLYFLQMGARTARLILK